MELHQVLPQGRLHLSPAMVEDAERMLRALNPESTKNLQFFTEPVSLEKQQGYLRKVCGNMEEELFLIERVADGQLIGTVGLHEIDPHNHNARLGLLIFNPTDRGQGFGTEAIALILQHAFTHHRCRKVYLKVFTENAIRVNHYTKLGFLLEGVFRQEYCLDGEYKDMLRMAIFSEDFERLYLSPS